LGPQSRGCSDSVKRSCEALGQSLRESRRDGCAGVYPAQGPLIERNREAFFEHHFHSLIVIDRRSIVVDANSAARQEIAEGHIGLFADGAFRLGSRECMRRFQTGLTEACSKPARWNRLVVRMVDGDWRLVSMRRLDEQGERTLVEVHAGAADRDADVEPLAQAFALTASDSAVLAYLLQARSPTEIADVIGISAHTVRAHMRAIYAKLGVRARSGVRERHCAWRAERGGAVARSIGRTARSPIAHAIPRPRGPEQKSQAWSHAPAPEIVRTICKTIRGQAFEPRSTTVEPERSQRALGARRCPAPVD
jgi:DNA-binding CsgD family transcriptional regulator